MAANASARRIFVGFRIGVLRDRPSRSAASPRPAAGASGQRHEPAEERARRGRVESLRRVGRDALRVPGDRRARDDGRFRSARAEEIRELALREPDGILRQLERAFT
jgi:hypothetical protein